MNIFQNIDLNNLDKLIIDPNDSTSYKNFNLKNYIDNKRNVIFFFIENSKEAINYYVELVKTKNIPILLSPNLDSNFIEFLIKKYAPNYILSKSNKILNVNYIKIKKLKNYYLYQEIKKIDHSPYDDLCLLMNTSGTTGSPKLVKLSYENILSNTKSICKFLKIKKNDITITTLQPHYTYGLSIINTHLFSKSKIIVNENSFFEKDFWTKFNKYNVSSFGAVSFMYEILKKIKFEKMNCNNLKYITHAGGKLDKNLHNYILKLCKIQKLKFITMYGQTEATSRISYLPYKFSNKKISSIGRAIPGGKMYIKGDKYKGEICYEGKNIMNGYALNKDDLRIKKNIKTLYTGDYGWRDKDGFFYIQGRKDRFIKYLGNRINLDEIDALLKEHGFHTVTKYSKNYFKIFYTKNYNFKKIKEIIFSKLLVNKKNIVNKKINEIPLTHSGKIKFANLK